MIKQSRFFIVLIALIIVKTSVAYNPVEVFDFNKSLRIDFILTGTAKTQMAGISNLYEEPHWSGNENSLIWPMDYGTYRYEVYTQDGQLVVRNGFSTLFEEWQMTNLPKLGPASFEESFNIPYPLQPVTIKLEVRRQNEFKLLSEWHINPDTDQIIKKNPLYKAQKLYGNGNPSESLDIVFLTDGYLAEDSIKAQKDTKRFAEYLFAQAPFNAFKDKINIWLVHAPSMNSGTTEPRKNIYKNTVLGSSFNSLGLERYLTTKEYFKIKDIAADAPYDFAVVMVNTHRYGGGGIFNHFSVFTSDNQWSKEVFVHEFGHQFGGLADEYFTSDVSYEEMLDTDKEPWNPNITTLVAFDGKWQNLISKGTPVPTPRSKKYKGKTGVFEGGAYMSKGVYSPSMDCKMRTNTAEGFCSACENAITEMLEMYTK
ncbi:MAG: peptidase [Salinivirgaceae bacterium]|nr:MAG: peptidase [Salinivirgaceae bacterium]